MTMQKKMSELRVLSEREIPNPTLLNRLSLSSFVKPSIQPFPKHNKRSLIESGAHKYSIHRNVSFVQSSRPCKQTTPYKENIGKLKAELRDVEDDLVKALAAKTRKEAERMRTMDSISATRARIEELKRVVEDQKARKNEFAAIMARQYEALSACEQSSNKNKRDVREIEEAMSWYNKILGFRLECGHGVKFIFTNIDPKNQSAEYSFSVRHENDLYTLLECDPPLKDINEAIQELNKSNGLFAFARTMRAEFQEAAARGNFPQTTSRNQATSTICLSAPALSVSSESRGDSNLSIRKIRPEGSNQSPKKSNHGRVGKAAPLSPGSASLCRRSPRFKVKK